MTLLATAQGTFSFIRYTPPSSVVGQPLVFTLPVAPVDVTRFLALEDDTVIAVNVTGTALTSPALVNEGSTYVFIYDRALYDGLRAMDVRSKAQGPNRKQTDGEIDLIEAFSTWLVTSVGKLATEAEALVEARCAPLEAAIETLQTQVAELLAAPPAGGP